MAEQSIEQVIKAWQVLLSDLRDRLHLALGNQIDPEDWVYHKHRLRVISDVGDLGYKQRCAQGPRYLQRVTLPLEAVEVVNQVLTDFNQDHQLGQLERWRQNEDLDRYVWKLTTTRQDTLSIDLNRPNDWNTPGLFLSLFIGPRYRQNDLEEAREKGAINLAVSYHF